MLRVTQPGNGRARVKSQQPGSIAWALGQLILLSLGRQVGLDVFEDEVKTKRKHIEAEDV